MTAVTTCFIDCADHNPLFLSTFSSNGLLHHTNMTLRSDQSGLPGAIACPPTSISHLSRLAQEEEVGDILQQWRLRRRLEEARRHVAVASAERSTATQQNDMGSVETCSPSTHHCFNEHHTTSSADTHSHPHNIHPHNRHPHSRHPHSHNPSSSGDGFKTSAVTSHEPLTSRCTHTAIQSTLSYQHPPSLPVDKQDDMAQTSVVSSHKESSNVQYPHSLNDDDNTSWNTTVLSVDSDSPPPPHCLSVSDSDGDPLTQLVSEV